MTKETSDKRRRGSIVALALIALGLMIAGAGTYALFSDTETSSPTLETHSIDLTQDSTLSFTAGNILPGDSGNGSVVLNTTGTVNGTNLNVSIDSINNTDVEAISSEDDIENGSNIPLSAELEVKMWVEDAAADSGGTEGIFDPTHDYGLHHNGTVRHNDGALSFADLDKFPLDSEYKTFNYSDDGTNKEFYVKWELPSSANNSVQRDRSTVNYNVSLAQ